MLPKKNALTEMWKQKFVIFALLFLIAMGCEWLFSAFLVCACLFIYICKHFNSFTLVNIVGTLDYLKTRQFVVQYSNDKSHVIGQAIQIPVW